MPPLGLAGHERGRPGRAVNSRYKSCQLLCVVCYCFCVIEWSDVVVWHVVRIMLSILSMLSMLSPRSLYLLLSSSSSSLSLIYGVLP